MQLIDQIPMKPETREAYRQMEAPARAWALTKAAFEAAEEANFSEQRAATVAATADDPEPPDWETIAPHLSRAEMHASLDRWRAWSDRNKTRIDAATKPIVARYPRELQKLAKLAEKNMVEWAAERMLANVGAERFERVKPAFTAYHDGDLYGDKLKTFLTICFNCPNT